jgi:hypothetical protein
MAGYAELNADQGADFSRTLELDDEATGNSLNLVGYTFSSHIKRSFLSLNPSAIFTCDVSDAAHGNVTISLTAGQTANLRPGRYLYDLKMQSPANAVSRVIEGIINIDPSIT